MNNIFKIDLYFDDKNWKKEKYINKKFIKNIFSTVLIYLKYVNIKSKIEFSINLSNEKEITLINKKYRNKNNSTNVLTFSLFNNIKDIQKIFEKNISILLGDIIFSYENIKNESITQNKTFKNHFIHLLVHSFLHLLSYDHIKVKDQKKMENIEINILKQLNIKNPYIY